MNAIEKEQQDLYSIFRDRKQDYLHYEEDWFTAENISIINFVNEDNILKSGELFLAEPIEQFHQELESDYMPIYDTEYRDDEEEYEERPRKRRLIREEDSKDNEGTVSLKAPTKFSLMTLIGGASVAVNVLVSATALYYTQTNFNEKVIDRLNKIEAKEKDSGDVSYSKSEEDLKYENIKTELRRQDELIKLLREARGGNNNSSSNEYYNGGSSTSTPEYNRLHQNGK